MPRGIFKNPIERNRKIKLNNSKHWLGKKFSETHKEGIKKARKIQVITQAHKDAVGVFSRKKWQNEEYRKHMSEIFKREKSVKWKGGNNYRTRRKYAPVKPDKCEVCETLDINLKKGLYVDHDHQTGKFRGWICTRCNVALGMVNDNKETLQKLINYLEKATSVGNEYNTTIK